MIATGETSRRVYGIQKVAKRYETANNRVLWASLPRQILWWGLYPWGIKWKVEGRRYQLQLQVCLWFLHTTLINAPPKYIYTSKPPPPCCTTFTDPPPYFLRFSPNRFLVQRSLVGSCSIIIKLWGKSLFTCHPPRLSVYGHHPFIHELQPKKFLVWEHSLPPRKMSLLLVLLNLYLSSKHTQQYNCLPFSQLCLELELIYIYFK